MACHIFAYIFLLFSFHIHIAHSLLSDPTLEFLNLLSQVKKGDNVKGVRQLKAYLSYLGCLTYNRRSKDQYQRHDNVFDDSLQIALKKYQQFHQLKITGTLDDTSIAKMQQQLRCGVPGFSNPNKSLPLHVTSHYSFNFGTPIWHIMNLSYYFDQNVKEKARTALRLSLNEWASATPFKFYRVRNFSEANIKLSFMSGKHGTCDPFGPADKSLAHSSGPPLGSIHFNNHKKWSWTGKRNAYDIQTVGTHELGHVLGLDHSAVVKAVMYPALRPGERKRLHKDDIDGIYDLYMWKRK